ncbi:hypothetical protein [Thauera sp.]
MRSLPRLMPAPTPRIGGATFVQGFVAGACVSAFQDQASPLSRTELKRVLRHGLQGGTALTAGSAAAHAVRRQDYAAALLAAAAGAAGVLIIERMLRERVQTEQEKKDVQEA